MPARAAPPVDLATDHLVRVGSAGAPAPCRSRAAPAPTSGGDPMRRQPEKQAQRALCALIRSLGGQVWVLGTRRRRTDYQGTMMSPGLPDCWFMLPPRRDLGQGAIAGWIEVKAPRGRLSAAQIAFRAACVESGVVHLVGGLDSFVAWCVAQGRVKADQVAPAQAGQSVR